MKVVRLSAVNIGRLYSPENVLVLISFKGLDGPRATVRPKDESKVGPLKSCMTSTDYAMLKPNLPFKAYRLRDAPKV
jgi:hypothetical protein